MTISPGSFFSHLSNYHKSLFFFKHLLHLFRRRPHATIIASLISYVFTRRDRGQLILSLNFVTDISTAFVLMCPPRPGPFFRKINWRSSKNVSTHHQIRRQIDAMRESIVFLSSGRNSATQNRAGQARPLWEWLLWQVWWFMFLFRQGALIRVSYKCGATSPWESHSRLHEAQAAHKVPTCMYTQRCNRRHPQTKKSIRNDWGKEYRRDQLKQKRGALRKERCTWSTL